MRLDMGATARHLGLVLFGERRLARQFRKRHHPALAGPGLQPLGQPAGQVMARGFGKADLDAAGLEADRMHLRSEEHTSELQSLMRISYAVFCLQKKKTQK